MTPDEALNALVETLEQLRTILLADKGVRDSDLMVQLAVERLWITAGNAAEEYRRAAGVDSGVGPWSELAAYRNRLAHALPGDLSTDRIWADTAADPPRIIADVRGAVH